jgi:hypothetical protein
MQGGAAVPVRWPVSKTPSLDDEIAMQRVLVLSKTESGRGRDLPLERTTAIASEGAKFGFTISGAMSLRRQLIRQLAPRSFFKSRNMGSNEGAREHAEQFEIRVAKFLEAQGVKFMSEKELRDSGHSSTPDFLLLGPVEINGTSVSWIDCKTFYGSSMLARSKDKQLPVTKLGSQAARYNTSFGNGAFVFLCGFSADLREFASLPPDLVLLDATPIDVDGIYD